MEDEWIDEKSYNYLDIVSFTVYEIIVLRQVIEIRVWIIRLRTTVDLPQERCMIKV